MDWNERYLNLAEHISTWSKDPSTKIGAVIIGEAGQVVSQGFNGFPRGILDKSRYTDREEKLKYVVHAEMNCIYNASLSGSKVAGSTLYVHGLPICSDCAKGIIQSGISRVIARYAKPKNDQWIKSRELAMSMFDEVGLKYSEIKL